MGEGLTILTGVCPAGDGARGCGRARRHRVGHDGGYVRRLGASDYYNRVEHGERIWPRLAARMPEWLKTIPALAVAAAVALGVYAAFLMRS